MNTVIESLGVYLPPKVVTTDEVLAGCARPPRIPFQWITGIKSRRVAGETEFAIDLAKQAVKRCLANSRHSPGDIDLLICTNIARCDLPDQTWVYEPSTSIRLREQFGFHRALVFDVANACAGMFTGIYIVDALIRSGCIQRAMVVSGEYITLLTDTAQKEIDGETDPRLACLSVGDSGAAVILECGESEKAGFEALDIYSLGAYYKCCIAGPTDRAHGGVTMLTDMKRLAQLCARHGRLHAEHIVKQVGGRESDIDWIIPHQTSRFTLDGLNLGGRLINNLAERGNTASTTHFVAMADHIANNRIQSYERILFSINASGITIGTAIYRLDDLPDRMRLAENIGPNRHAALAASSARPFVAKAQPINAIIDSVGTVVAGETTVSGDAMSADTTAMLKAAAEHCLRNSSFERDDIDLIIYAGIYRTGFIMEPSIASIAAGELRMKSDIDSFEGGKTLAFDLFNGATGFLNACQVAQEMIRAGRARQVMVCTAEVEANAQDRGYEPCGLRQAASAMILRASDGTSGFGTCVTSYFTNHLDACWSYVSTRRGPPYRLTYDRNPRLLELYVQCIMDTLPDLLREAGLELAAFRWIVPPQISGTFVAAVRSAIGIDREQIIDVTDARGDWFTSSVPVSFDSMRRSGRVRQGELALFISVGSGIQVSCATYRF